MPTRSLTIAIGRCDILFEKKNLILSLHLLTKLSLIHKCGYISWIFVNVAGHECFSIKSANKRMVKAETKITL